MQDLYKRLGIKPGASREEIAVAASLKPELASRAAILLDEHRRAKYDRAHATLSAIGTLRHRIRLESGTAVFCKQHPDFAVGNLAEDNTGGPVRPKPSAPSTAKQDPVQRKQRAPARRTRFNWPVIMVVLVFIVILAVLTVMRG